MLGAYSWGAGLPVKGVCVAAGPCHQGTVPCRARKSCAVKRGEKEAGGLGRGGGGGAETVRTRGGVADRKPLFLSGSGCGEKRVFRGCWWELLTLCPVEARVSASCLNLGAISQFTPYVTGHLPRSESPGSQDSIFCLGSPTRAPLGGFRAVPGNL